ncbi:MAG: hypothetical protein SWC96_14985, partial [Thermodesulfobacteriota bacterium]|nr:hypothetical protein [Thermodesulfobacteriota bacterium]
AACRPALKKRLSSYQYRTPPVFSWAAAIASVRFYPGFQGIWGIDHQTNLMKSVETLAAPGFQR